jgi:hypothetical protein
VLPFGERANWKDANQRCKSRSSVITFCPNSLSVRLYCVDQRIDQCGVGRRESVPLSDWLFTPDSLGLGRCRL